MVLAAAPVWAQDGAGSTIYIDPGDEVGRETVWLAESEELSAPLAGYLVFILDNDVQGVVVENRSAFVYVRTLPGREKLESLIRAAKARRAGRLIVGTDDPAILGWGDARADSSSCPYVCADGCDEVTYAEVARDFCRGRGGTKKITIYDGWAESRCNDGSKADAYCCSWWPC
ncbi:MAG: hypothetical protein Q9Q40_12355 [Acidobacteriota bacterium]|nr:hypothetical protein [Acidobacteriota bacterium]MDQ7088668.1 hypothetical protein [Acidobacteriota bacterium]